MTLIPSPCMAVCEMDASTGFCRGCLRTRGEIKEWAGADEARRLAILRDLQARRAALGICGEGKRRHKGRRRG